MSEENTEEIELEQEIDTPDTSTEDTGQTDSAEDTTDWKAEAQKLQAILDRKSKPKPQAQPTNPPPASADADELRLIARGLSDEEIDQAKVIAKGTGSSLTEAIKTPLFAAFQKDLKDQQRKEKAKLNASHGSGEETQKSLSELSRDEHQKLAQEAAANIQ